MELTVPAGGSDLANAAILERMRAKGTLTIEHRKADGTLIQRIQQDNLRTNNGFQYFADQMGGALGTSGQATGTSSTTLTDSGQAWTVNQWAGYKVIAALAGSLVSGTILSNTATALTIDAWKVIGTGATGATPGSTAAYAIEARARAKYIALSTDGTAASASDSTITSEVSGNGLDRALATYAYNSGTKTFTLVVTFTASGTQSNIQKVYLVDAKSGAPTVVNEATWTPVVNIVATEVLTVTWSIALS